MKIEIAEKCFKMAPTIPPAMSKRSTEVIGTAEIYITKR